jgi:hypothetical protein
MLVSAFMVALVIWLLLGATPEQLDATSRIPLRDEADDG